MEKLVSIIMPSYNTGDFIGKSIKTVLAQTYENWELIIVDDCSSDDTESVVAGFDDKRIRYIKNQINSGAAVSRNRALCEASGKWIAFLDSDDLWLPEKLERQVDFMEQNGYRFSYTTYSEIDEMSKLIGKTVSGPKRVTKAGMYNYCWPGCLTVMYDADFVGPIQIEDIKKNNDYAMWLKICKIADCMLLDEDLARYRKRSGSISNHSYAEMIKWHYRLYRYAEKMNRIKSLWFTILNLFFGVYKKLVYVKRSGV